MIKVCFVVILYFAISFYFRTFLHVHFFFACLVETSPIENFLKAERASVNSYKSKYSRMIATYH